MPSPSRTRCRRRWTGWPVRRPVPVTLPRHLDWGPPYAFDLGDPADLVLMYERVIREAQSPADLHDHLNRVTLLRIWPELFLPRELRAQWHARFPELGPRAAAA